MEWEIGLLGGTGVDTGVGGTMATDTGGTGDKCNQISRPGLFSDELGLRLLLIPSCKV